MKKLFVLVLSGWLCGSAFAQPNSQPAQNPPAAGTQTPTAAPAAPTTGSVGDKNALYTDRIPPEQIVTLDAGGDKFLARRVADLSGLPRGAAIILHDSGQHPNWPFTVAALIDDLPLHGWDTLNIELPAPTASTPNTEAATQAATPPTAAANSPAATSNPASGAAPASPSTPTSPASTPITGAEAQAQARIAAAIKYYADQNQRNIALIGFGSGAIRAAENLRSITTATPNSTAPLTALVMIAPQQQLKGIELDLPKLLPLTGIAALDMMLDSDAQARAEAEARRRAVLHQRTRVYTRIELPPLNGSSDPQHSAMVKRVRTWLQKNAAAMQQPGG